MDISLRYENAALTWNTKIARLGYTKAYSDFFANDVLRSGPVLDVGTGTGAFAQTWVDVGGSSYVTLLDPSMAMLKQAQAQFAARGLRPTLAHCTFDDFRPDTQFEAVLAAHVLEHFDDPAAAMHHFAQMLTPNGRLYLAVSKPHWCNWLIWLRFRHRWFKRTDITAMAHAAGLTEVAVRRFRTGPPSRTSLGYIFQKTQPKET